MKTDQDYMMSFHDSGLHRDFVFHIIFSELEDNHYLPFRLHIHDKDFGLGKDIM